jgi:hypothetical protein
MITQSCESCKRETGHRRAFSIATLIAVLLTGGLWVLALPFYPIRCVVCGAPTKWIGLMPCFFWSIVFAIAVIFLWRWF